MSKNTDGLDKTKAMYKICSIEEKHSGNTKNLWNYHPETWRHLSEMAILKLYEEVKIDVCMK